MQTELFELTTSDSTPTAEVAPKTSVLEKKILTLRLDQAIGLVLVLMVVYVMSFTWGVEKGKSSVRNSQIITKTQTTPLPTALPENLTLVEEAPSLADRIETAPAATIPVDASLTQIAESKPKDSLTDKPSGKYTIQHVIYVTESAAEREIKKLNKKGQTAFMIPSGKYLQVCVSGFQTKSEANKSLRQLRNQGIVASDAYVRPIPA